MKRVWRVGGVRLTVWSTIPEGKPRGDVYMPASYLTVGLLALIFGLLISIIMFAAGESNLLIPAGLLSASAGIMTLLEWKNRIIRMISEDSFAYSTIFRRKRMCSFSDIVDVRQGLLSLMLVTQNDRIRIESDAVVSERFAQRLEARMREICGADSVWHE